MNLSLETLIEVLKTIVLVSVLFVWVVRYNNIKNEFEQYKLTKRLRDIVGIMKISFALMLQSDIKEIVLIGAGGILFLMSAAIITHIRVKNNLYNMLPALTMFSLCLIILLYSL
tara:strand:+ start:2178 stop:2519 length:342 start_codon:yes stop_codon:yes gene_type:complete